MQLNEMHTKLVGITNEFCLIRSVTHIPGASAITLTRCTICSVVSRRRESSRAYPMIRPTSVR